MFQPSHVPLIQPQVNTAWSMPESHLGGLRDVLGVS